jgi:hypothetical protein
MGFIDFFDLNPYQLSRQRKGNENNLAFMPADTFALIAQALD